jgi:hypothetical protein
MENKTTLQKITGIEKGLEYYQQQRFYLNKNDVIDVCRFVTNSLNDRSYIDMTVHDAIKNNQWDTCRGTMSYDISFGDDTNRYQVYRSGRRCYIELDGGTP